MFNCMENPSCSFNILVVLFCFSLLSPVIANVDYYEILKVSRSASQKEIRQAFKKLAVSEHPDKKTDDPNAHEKFLKITRAYEVLKDDKLRKKFDTYGEDGLKEDFHGGHHYESWSFYQDEFGIYDDDPEIITLSLSDFEQSVEGTEDIWFINYYSPHCSHCHHLAPVWREVARQLDGVLRIGAVNCQDDWNLCRMQGIRSYPTLMLYPVRERYKGERSTEALIKYALANVQANVFTLYPSNFKSETTERNLPWLINYCSGDGDCLSSNTELKVATMLESLVNVGTVNCDRHSSLCSKMGASDGVYFYKLGEVEKDKGMAISSLVAQEVAHEVLLQLPDVTLLNEEQLQNIRHENEENTAWVVHFFDKDEVNLELRKIPSLLEDENIHVGRVDCRILQNECHQLHIFKMPTFVLFKSSGGHEIYYGRTTAHDVAAFAKESVKASLEALGPNDFPHRVVDSQDPWFVDFFAPWCPPCMRLLPEFRKASKSYGKTISFGSVDCTVHQGLCTQYNIRSYPTTIFYNRSTPHHYHGQHRAQDMIDFIEDTLHPSVEQLTPDNFHSKVNQRGQNEIWVVDFFAPWCGPCQQLAPEWRKLSKMFKSNKNVHIADIDCKKHRSLCQQEGVHSYPTMRLYPLSGSSLFESYNGWNRDVQSLHAWVYEFLPSKVVTLRSSSFHSKVINSKQPWIVDFYASWCGHCQIFKPQFEQVAAKLEGIVHAGKVDCEVEFQICQQYGISAYPSVRLFTGSKHYKNGYDIDSQDAEEIIDIVNSRLQKKKSKKHDEF
ncbi:dnaJ homolog subfamily C member 10 [Octopus sinensis]|uniref:DnaJ homolog subfamily C member 10 n=1 Tax=Octopus sinensis TaxID=2607531 RepID=A0A6P7STG1_9MOLL|nr:dnaJ homolog subfamily C member 10 [Octopus sinensis]XP_036359330.1 dnaJ homolog subfamily C member 10 [Octopus sinensis]